MLIMIKYYRRTKYRCIKFKRYYLEEYNESKKENKYEKMMEIIRAKKIDKVRRVSVKIQKEGKMENSGMFRGVRDELYNEV